MRLTNQTHYKWLSALMDAVQDNQISHTCVTLAIHYMSLCNKLGWKNPIATPRANTYGLISNNSSYKKAREALSNAGFINELHIARNQNDVTVIELVLPEYIEKDERYRQKALDLPQQGAKEDKANPSKPKQPKPKSKGVDVSALEGNDSPEAKLLKWLYENCPRVSKMKQPLTIDEAKRLTVDFGKSKEDKNLLRQTFEAMENYAKLHNSISANRTVRKWMNKAK